MLSIALLVHVQRVTGSFAAAGLATGAYGAAIGLGGPLLGRLADRRGQHGVLLASGGATALQLVVLALLPAGAPTVLLVALAAGIGFARPPVGPCLRAALPRLVPDGGAMRRVYAVEASAAELTFIAGPPLALAIATAWSTRTALAGAGIVLFVATVVFALQSADGTGMRPTGEVHTTPAVPTSRAGSLTSPAIVALIMVLSGVGIAFGAVEVSVTAAATQLGGTIGAAPLLSLWAVGSLIGGLLTARIGAERLGLGTVVAALAVSHTALALGVGSAPLLGLIILLAGATIAPSYTVIYAIAGDAAPEGTATEAFAWLATAISVGAAVGAAIAGAAVDQAGPTAGFLVGGVGGLLAVAVVAIRSTAFGGKIGTEGV
jgi:MFS family permease